MANIEAKSREEWLKLANSADATQRKQVTEALRTLGLSSAEFMPMDAAARVDYIMSKQGGGEEKKTESKKDANTATGGGKAASGGGGGLTDEDRKLLKENVALGRKIHDLLVVIALTDPKVKGNAEEMDVKLELLGNG